MRLRVAGAGVGAAATALMSVVALAVLGLPAGTASAATPLTIAEAFAAPAIPLNGATTLTITIHNPDPSTTGLGVAFVGSLQTGLMVNTPNDLSNSCGGTPTATPGSTMVALAGGTVAPGANCTVSVLVVGTTLGTFTSFVGPVSSTNGGTGNSATATLIVANLTIAKAFGVPAIPLQGTTSLTFTIHALVGPLTGVALIDNLPTGLAVATPTALTNNCGGTATATAGSMAVSLSGGALAATASCTVSANVVGIALGAQNNSVSVSSANGGIGNTAMATVTVTAPTAPKPTGATALFTG